MNRDNQTDKSQSQTGLDSSPEAATSALVPSDTLSDNSGPVDNQRGSPKQFRPYRCLTPQLIASEALSPSPDSESSFFIEFPVNSREDSLLTIRELSPKSKPAVDDLTKLPKGSKILKITLPKD